MRVLLTGSSGWLGRYLAPVLRGAGHDVTGLDVAPGADTDMIGTVADRGLIDRVFADRSIEAVIHAAALHKPDIVRYPTQAFVDVNVTGTLNLLEAAVEHGVQRFVFTSTTSLMISQKIRDGKAVIARVGGEEFLVAESIGMQEALQTAEAMRVAIAATPWYVTASLGVSSTRLPMVIENPGRQIIESLVEAADAAMYEAKRAGGNRVRTSTFRYQPD